MVVAEVMVPKGISGPEHRAYILIPHIKRQALMKKQVRKNNSLFGIYNLMIYTMHCFLKDVYYTSFNDK